MASNRIVEALQLAAIFQGLAPPQLADLARHAERIKFAAGDYITRAGDAGDGAYLLVSGAAERLPEPGLEEAPDAVQPGSLVGQLAMLVDHVYGSTVIARERVFCLKVTRAGVHAQMTADPALARHFERHVTQRLLGVARQLREIDSLLQARRPGIALSRPPLAISAPPAQPALGAAPAP
jgi:CRP/FNR family transcriptional regulator, cyclic AMP receptor protein